jgi:hypothetical protein
MVRSAVGTTQMHQKNIRGVNQRLVRINTKSLLAIGCHANASSN